MLKAINTKYNGYNFRSRLEARWAIYFDQFGVEWLYEHEGYDLDGTYYLPDFYFPKFKMYAEVKPTDFTEDEKQKCVLLAKQSMCPVIQLVGAPNIDTIAVIMPHKGRACSACGHVEHYDWTASIVKCDCNAEERQEIHTTDAEAILLLYCEEESFKPLYYGECHSHFLKDGTIEYAIQKAKSARFEHGATPF